jgi:hypothetical protein
MRDDRNVPGARGPSFVRPNEQGQEARAGDSTREHGRADYEKRADREAKEELSSIVILRSPSASFG